MNTYNFNRRILLVANDKKEADWTNRIFTKAGGATMEVETVPSNILSRLGDDNIEACVLYTTVLENGENTTAAPWYTFFVFMDTLRGIFKTKSKPIVVIDPHCWEEQEMYEHGVNIVISNQNFDEKDASLALLKLETILNLIDAYKEPERKIAFRV